jgi:hypothetical protein
VLGHAGEQLELGDGKPQGGIGRAGRAAHGAAQPGYDIGHLRADLLLADLFLRYVSLS